VKRMGCLLYVLPAITLFGRLPYCISKLLLINTSFALLPLLSASLYGLKVPNRTDEPLNTLLYTTAVEQPGVKRDFVNTPTDKDAMAIAAAATHKRRRPTSDTVVATVGTRNWTSMYRTLCFLTTVLSQTSLGFVIVPRNRILQRSTPTLPPIYHKPDTTLALFNNDHDLNYHCIATNESSIDNMNGNLNTYRNLNPTQVQVAAESVSSSNSNANQHHYTTSKVITSSSLNGWNNTQMSRHDLQCVEEYWERLLPTVNYLGTTIVAKIYQALCVAYQAHCGQMRKSGDPFIIHPVEVALLLSNLKMDGETVMAGLLHDTVEDTDLTFDDVEALFGHTVRGIVEGETKVSKLPKLACADYAAVDEQAENLRQMFVAMTDDYRIIIVKLADRLHNMRTLQHMKPAKQVKISRETLDIFAPLAHRMGIWQFKSELEDTAFMYLYPTEYAQLKERLQQHQHVLKTTLDKTQELLQQQLRSDVTLQQQAAKVEVFGRTKEIYSLWHKMESKQEHNLDRIVDVVALRVIITPPPQQQQHQDGADAVPDSSTSYNAASEPQNDRGVWLCYHVLGLVQHLPGFQPVPTRVKDYISVRLCACA
jgi:hypothetical protein